MDVTADQPFPIQDNDHGLTTGMLIGTLMSAGLMATPQVDEDGNWTATLEIPLGISDDFGGPVIVRVVVLPRDPSPKSDEIDGGAYQEPLRAL